MARHRRGAQAEVEVAHVPPERSASDRPPLLIPYADAERYYGALLDLKNALVQGNPGVLSLLSRFSHHVRTHNPDYQEDE